jgi:hypothetical protein
MRIVEGVRSLDFALFAEYRCSKCHGDKSSLDADALTKMGVPLSVIHKLPVIQLHDSLWTSELYADFAGSITTKLGPGEFANMIEEKRTGRWVEDNLSYLLASAEKQYAHGWVGLGFQSLERPRPFPGRDTHCDGYVGSPGPSAAQFGKVLPTAFKKVELFGDLFMASLGGKVLSGDHTYFIAAATKIAEGIDTKTIFNVMNERQQIVSWRYTATEGDSELKGISEELLLRYLSFGDMEQNGKEVKRQPVFALDKCCAGVQWLKMGGWTSPLATMDNYHLQQRFAAVATHAAGESLINLSRFRTDLSRAFGAPAGSPGLFKESNIILNELAQIKAKYSQQQFGHIWTDKMDTTLENQRIHITNCLALPEDVNPLVFDRNGLYVLSRGTGKNECLHRYAIICNSPQHSSLTLTLRCSPPFFLVHAVTHGYSCRKNVQFHRPIR